MNSLETRIEKMQARFNKDLEEIKNSQYIMSNAINETERKKENQIKRNEDNLRDLQDSIKRPNIRIIAVPKEEDKKKDHEKILEEIIVENFPKMRKEIITQVQETQRVPNRIYPR